MMFQFSDQLVFVYLRFIEMMFVTMEHGTVVSMEHGTFVTMEHGYVPRTVHT